MEDPVVFDLVFDGQTIHGSAAGSAGIGREPSSPYPIYGL